MFRQLLTLAALLDHGIKAHERAKGPNKLVVIPNITHYGVYRKAREQVQKKEP